MQLDVLYASSLAYSLNIYSVMNIREDRDPKSSSLSAIVWARLGHHWRNNGRNDRRAHTLSEYEWPSLEQATWNVPPIVSVISSLQSWRLCRPSSDINVAVIKTRFAIFSVVCLYAAVYGGRKCQNDRYLDGRHQDDDVGRYTGFVTFPPFPGLRDLI